MSQRVAPAKPPHDLVGRQPIDVANVIAQLRQRARLPREPGDASPDRVECRPWAADETVLAALVLEHRHDGRPHRSEVRGRHQVEGRPHQRALDELPLDYRAVEVGELEPGEARPEADVRRCRLLGLQATDPFHRPDDVDIGRLEEQLPRQHRPAEPAGADDLGRGGPRHSGGSLPALKVAMSSV